MFLKVFTIFRNIDFAFVTDHQCLQLFTESHRVRLPASWLERLRTAVLRRPVTGPHLTRLVALN